MMSRFKEGADQQPNSPEEIVKEMESTSTT